MSDTWGKGAENNTINWGQAASNATNGFGESQKISWSGDTNIVGILFQPFQMQFDTSGGKTITIPDTVGSSYTVDWGDTTVTTETDGDISHTYASGISTSIVSIGAFGDVGAFTTFAFNNGGSKSDLLDVPQWGSIVWSSMSSMFYGCNNTSFTQISATDNPISDNVTSMYNMFRSATYFNSDISGFNVDSLVSAGNMFYAATAFNNGDLGNNGLKPLSWDFTNNSTGLTSFNDMFHSTTSSFNQDVSSFKISGNAASFFYNQSIFNNGGQSLNTLDVSAVTNFTSMFQGTPFNQNIHSWNISSATNFSRMFQSVSQFNQNISDWYINGFNTSLSSFYAMLYGTSMTDEQFTDTIVGWAVAVSRDSGPYNISAATNASSAPTNATFLTTRTQDTDNSGNSVDYSTKYGNDWDSNWTNAGDARQFLLDNGWSIN